MGTQVLPSSWRKRWQILVDVWVQDFAEVQKEAGGRIHCKIFSPFLTVAGVTALGRALLSNFANLFPAASSRLSCLFAAHPVCYSSSLHFGHILIHVSIPDPALGKPAKSREDKEVAKSVSLGIPLASNALS